MLKFYANGVLLKSPSGLKKSEEKVWSTNTGRSTTAKMIGDIIAKKVTFDMQWMYVSKADYKKISENLGTINNPYPKLKVVWEDGEVEYDVNVYSSEITSEYLYAKYRDAVYRTVTVSIIQQ